MQFHGKDWRNMATKSKIHWAGTIRPNVSQSVTPVCGGFPLNLKLAGTKAEVTCMKCRRFFGRARVCGKCADMVMVWLPNGNLTSQKRYPFGEVCPCPHCGSEGL